jgi:hypothetical protein
MFHDAWIFFHESSKIFILMAFCHLTDTEWGFLYKSEQNKAPDNLLSRKSTLSYATRTLIGRHRRHVEKSGEAQRQTSDRRPRPPRAMLFSARVMASYHETSSGNSTIDIEANI